MYDAMATCVRRAAWQKKLACPEVGLRLRCFFPEDFPRARSAPEFAQVVRKPPFQVRHLAFQLRIVAHQAFLAR